jgi:hypothetical protein
LLLAFYSAKLSLAFGAVGLMESAGPSLALCELGALIGWLMSTQTELYSRLNYVIVLWYPTLWGTFQRQARLALVQFTSALRLSLVQTYLSALELLDHPSKWSDEWEGGNCVAGASSSAGPLLRYGFSSKRVIMKRPPPPETLTP